jgi:hypothetical protein
VLYLAVSESAWGIDKRGQSRLFGGQGSSLRSTEKRLRLASMLDEERREVTRASYRRARGAIAWYIGSHWLEIKRMRCHDEPCYHDEGVSQD